MATSKRLAAPQPLKVAFPLGSRGALRFQEKRGFQEGRGALGGEKEKTRARKSGQLVRAQSQGFAKGGFQKGGFWRMFACTKPSSQKIFPCSATLAEASYDFGYSSTPTTGTRAHSPEPHIRQNPPFCFLSTKRLKFLEATFSGGCLQHAACNQNQDLRVGCRPRGSYDNTFLRRGLRRFSRLLLRRF